MHRTEYERYADGKYRRKKYMEEMYEDIETRLRLQNEAGFFMQRGNKI